MRYLIIPTITGVLIVLVAAGSLAQQPYSYPNAGQSQAQVSRDRWECHNWGIQQSGYDPSRPSAYVQAPPPSSGYQQPPSGSGALGGAARGAARGAIIGGIAGDAGRGAAAGALMGSVRGVVQRSRQRQQYQEAERQRQQQYANQQLQAGQQNYSRAYAACMQARNYTVR